MNFPKLTKVKNDLIERIKGAAHDVACETVDSVQEHVTVVLKNSSGDILEDVVTQVLKFALVGISLVQAGKALSAEDVEEGPGDIRKDYGDYYEVHNTYNYYYSKGEKSDEGFD